MSAPKFSHLAQEGFAAAEAYDAHRPSYPPEAMEKFLEALEVKGVGRAKLIDLAAGTGKLTEVLSQRPENYEIAAIEPHAGMLEQLKAKKLPNVTTQPGSAEDMTQIPSESVAAVAVGQAFHWFANMTALKEIHRVLQPAGVLGVIWNIEDYNAPQSWNIRPGWETALNRVIWSQEDNQQRYRHEKWKDVFDEQNAGNPLTKDPLFGMPIGEDSFEHVVYLSKPDLWSRFRTLSQIAILKGDELKGVEKIFNESVDAPETEVDNHGRIAVHVKTVFAWTSKIPTVPMKSDQAM